MNINVTLTKTPKEKPTGTLGFCKYYTDHMFLMNYSTEKGWYNPRIEPYGPIALSPATTVFHYGQAIFEGMKCYRGNDGKIRFFRPMDNFKRMNDSADRICMPHLDMDMAMEGLKELVKIDQSWIPTEKGHLFISAPLLSELTHISVLKLVIHIFSLSFFHLLAATMQRDLILSVFMLKMYTVEQHVA
jgi:Branched-chain amino acid aminotransferase/4-amino-4-deoxychorismate lyase